MISSIFEWIHSLPFWYYMPIALAFLGLAFALPLRVLMSTYGYRIRHKAIWSVLFGPLTEEILFRFVLLIFLIGFIGTVPAVAVVTIIYSVYMASVYGPQFSADGLVLGILFSFAFLEFGLPIIIIAHIIYGTTHLFW